MTKIVALHGFLGQPKDWDFLNFQNLKALDLFKMNWESLDHLAKQIIETSEPDSILMGYSMGGRAALHALSRNSSHWKAAIIISAHPGLMNAQEKAERQIDDDLWATRFLSEDWTSLMNDWNGRSSFGASPFVFQRKESDFDRERLAGALRKGSLGLQQDLRPMIQALPLPILWITGKQDLSYSKLADSVNLTDVNSKKMQLERAAHRTPWEQPEAFQTLILEWIKRLR